MKSLISIAASALLLVAVYACKTATTGQGKAAFNYDYLYTGIWVVDTLLTLGPDVPNIETDKNEYQFTREGTSTTQGTRTTITPLASVSVSYTITDGTIHFDPGATFMQTKFDAKTGQLLGTRYMGLPAYKIMELSPTKLTLKSDAVLMKLKAK
ncbi:MAG: hypothetical protein H6555_05290 [Lewinellaceae bacterium]|nr:hypothetical protein [Lewinellaceae bacterium]